MSLVEQSQQWYPTSVQVTVHQARSLRVKGKSGTNDAYAIIQVAKDKFSTSVAEKSVAPVWKEEASFDLPLFHPGNAERCTLNVVVMHRAQVGLDKFLGQAVVNLLDLHDNNSRKKTDWFKLVEKNGKEDKVRGEVLLDIQFMRNNMSASMFDLSMQDKPRSRVSKLKDKVRGKKKDSFSDSASAIVPSVSQVLTDSDAEADAQSLNQSPGVKKKSRLKTLFAPKSNLQRNVSQSMSTLGTLPEKNSSLSSSRSSGLNVDSPEVKKKFKFLGHKRTGSNDSKASQGPFSLTLLGRSKQSNSDPNNTCINGSHVYTEDAEPKSGSTASLNSSGQGSVEDVYKHASDVSAGSFQSVPDPTYRHESTERAVLEQQRHQEEEERRQAEERHKAEAKRAEEEEQYQAVAKRLKEEEERRYQEEQQRNRKFLEEDAMRKKQKQQEEEERRRQEEERRMLQAAENQRLEEERRKGEEQKRQEDASMSDRLSTLFGIIRKKDEKKEEVQQNPKEESPELVPSHDSRNLEQLNSHHSTNPFEDISLSSGPTVTSNESPADHEKSSRNPQTPSAMVFLNRTAKVSAVKPRLAQSLESEPPDCQTPSQLCPSPTSSESTLCSVPTESPDTFFKLHSSLAPPDINHSLPGSPFGSSENLSSAGSAGSSPTMSDKKRKAPLPTTYAVHGNQAGGNYGSVREIKSLEYADADRYQQDKKLSLPLPDYETLFPQKRHGVQGHTRWDHIIAEVNQRQRDAEPELQGPEMSVDGPEEHEPSPRSSTSQEIPAYRNHQTKPEENRPMPSKKVAALVPPKPDRSPESFDNFSQRLNQNTAHQSAMGPSPSVVPGPMNTDISPRESLSGLPKDGARKVLSPTATHAPRPSGQMGTSPPEDPRKAQVSINKEAPTAKPRQRDNSKELTPNDSAVTTEKSMNSNTPTLLSQSMRNMHKKSREAKENMAEFDPFPSTEILPRDPWAQLKQNQGVDGDNLFTGNIQKEQTNADQGMTADDLDEIFSQDKPMDPFAGFNSSDSNEDSNKASFPFFQRKNSGRQNQSLRSKTPSDKKGPNSRQEPAFKEEQNKTVANQGPAANVAKKESVALQPQAEVKTQSSHHGGEVQFGAEPFPLPTAFTSPEPLHVIMEEPAGGLSGGKAPLQAWVSPSEVQPVSAQNSNGGGLAMTPRRPHPVKPLTTAESQNVPSTQSGKEIKAWDNTPRKIKVADSGGSGPYTQLTQEELITLVVRQQTDLSKKDAKIVELEEYIDNLVLRVIEEQPSILQSLNSPKPV